MKAARDRIQTLEQLAPQVRRWRARGQTVVFANGCFDIVHVGHVRYLRAARRRGDRLVVGVNGDRSARRIKGAGRPVLPARARAELVAGLRGVDAVVIFSAPTVAGLLRRLRPDVHAKGTDYTAASVPESGLARRLGIRVCIVGDAKRHATTDLLRQIAAAPER